MRVSHHVARGVSFGATVAAPIGPFLVLASLIAGVVVGCAIGGPA